MPNFPIRFRNGQGLEASPAQNTQTGLIELLNADVSKRDVIQKRTGSDGVALTRSSDETDVIPAASTQALWYRDHEMVLQTDEEIYARQECAEDGDAVTLGTADANEINQATDRIVARAATTQSFTVTVGTDAFGANVRTRLDRSDTTESVGILVNPPDPDDVEIVVDISGSQVRWTATNTTTGTINGPNNVPGATAKRLPRVMAVTGGVGLDVVITWISQDGTDAKLNALGLAHVGGTNASFNTFNYLNRATLRGGWTHARYEARDGLFSAFDSAGVLNVWSGNAPATAPEVLTLAGTQTPPSALAAYSFDMRAPGGTISTVCGFAWASSGEATLRALAVTPSTGVVTYQAQESYAATASGTTVSIERSDPGGQPNRYVVALRRSGIGYDPVFELSTSSTLRYADLGGLNLTVEFVEVSGQLRYTHARGATFLVPFAVLDTGVTDASFEGLGNAIYGGYVNASGLREVQYDTTLAPSSVLRQAGVTRFAHIVQGSSARVGLACFNTASTLRVFLRASALAAALNTSTITAPEADFGSYPMAVCILGLVAVNDATLRVHALRSDGVTLHTWTVDTASATVTVDSQRTDTLPAGATYLDAIGLGLSPRTLLGVRYSGGQTEIYEINTSLFVRVSPATVSLPGGNWTRRGPWTQKSLRLNAVANLDDGESFVAADIGVVQGDHGECSLIVAELSTGGVTAYVVSSHIEASEVIDAGGVRPRIVRIDDETLLVAYVTAANDIAYSYWSPSSGFSFTSTGVTLTAALVWDIDSGTYQSGKPAAIIAYRANTADVGFLVLRPGEVDITQSIAVAQDAVFDVSVQFGPDDAGNDFITLAWAAIGETLPGEAPLGSAGLAAIDTSPAGIIQLVNRSFSPSANLFVCSVGSRWTDSAARVWIEYADGAYRSIEFWTVTVGAAGISATTIRQASILTGQRRMNHETAGGNLAGWLALHGSLPRRSGLFCYAPETGEVLSRAAVGRTESLAMRFTRSKKAGWTLGPDDSMHLAPLLRVDANGSALAQVDTLAHQTPGPNRPAQTDHTVIAAHAGYPRAYDGLSVYEHDWHELPLIDSAVGVAAGSMPAGTYNGAVRWEWTDATGLSYRCAPTFWKATITASQNIQITVRALRLSERSNVRLVAYRGVVGAGVPYFRVTDVAAQSTSANVVITLSELDADIRDNEQLDQIPGGLLTSTQGSITDFCAFASERLWGPDPERRSLVRFTVPRFEGEAVHWNGTQGLELPTQRPAVGLVEQSGRVIVFAGPGLAATEGAGPDRLGNGGYPAFTSIPSDEGGINQNAHARTSEGVLYGSPLGPRLLRGSLDSVSLGAPLELLYKERGQRIVATEAAYSTGTCHLFDDGDTAGRGTVRWHVESNRWAQDTLRQAKDAATSPAGQLAILTTDGRVLVESSDEYTEGGLPYETAIRTPWLRAPLGDLTTAPAYQASKLYVVGTYLGPHDLNIDVFYDLAEEPEVMRRFPAATLLDDFTAGRPYIYELRLDRPCYAVSVRVFDGAEPNATFRIEAIDIYWSQPEVRPAETHSKGKSEVR